jgi:hypothetical protein
MVGNLARILVTRPAFLATACDFLVLAGLLLVPAELFFFIGLPLGPAFPPVNKRYENVLGISALYTRFYRSTSTAPIITRFHEPRRHPLSGAGVAGDQPIRLPHPRFGNAAGPRRVPLPRKPALFPGHGAPKHSCPPLGLLYFT